jgi:hypothetical protein
MRPTTTITISSAKLATAVAVELLTEREIFTVEPSRTTDGVWHFMVTDSGKAKALALMQALGY